MNHYPIIEFHILQSFPVACLNRDDLGAPKTCIIGGTTRARVSSQCWKRAVRLQLHEQGVTLAVRTKKLAERLAQKIEAMDQTPETAKACADKIGGFLSDDSLIFLTDVEYQQLAEYAKSKSFDPDACKDKEVQKLIKRMKTSGIDGLDVALFGRMVAKAPVMNVEAAACFSHAVSTHAVANELDFFTALDDLANEGEAQTAHMGASEFVSVTYYRYISLNVQQLVDTLGLAEAADITKAVRAFIYALYLAVPAARQTTMSAANFWDFARVYVRRGQRMQCACDNPVKAKQDGYLTPSIESLKSELDAKKIRSGSLFGEIAEFDFGEPSSNCRTIDELVDSVTKVVVQ